MQRKTLLVAVLGVSLAAALAGCGSDSKSQATTPVAATEPAEPAEPAQPEPAPAEPAPPPEPPAPTYLHGKWVWFELRSTAPDKSKAFYSELLGWQIETQEMSGMKFELVKAGGKDIAIISATEGKAKSHWVPYVSVPDVDAAVKTIEEQKGKVVTPASDIPNIGRYAIVSDPNGGEFAVFKGLRGDEPDAPPSVGTFVWNEYLTRNKKQHQAALAFYPAAIGFTTSQVPMGEGKKATTYDMLSIVGDGGKPVPRAGVQAARPASLGGAWLPWVTVEDTDAVVANVKKLKGKVLVKPNDIPSVGRAAVVADSTGAALGLLKPDTQEQPAAAQPNAEQPAQPDAARPAEGGAQ
jgi:hypothetical protein